MKKILLLLLVTLHLVHPANLSALTMEQFADICDSAPGDCSNHPVLQAYVGGALDLLATLDEETEYLGQVYCEDPRELFDVPAIIRYMVSRRAEYASRNAMLVMVRYFEDNGGCQ